MALALMKGEKEKQAEFMPPPFDTMALVGVPTVPEELGWSELDATAFKAALCGDVSVENNVAEIWMTNFESNDVWLKLRVLDTKGNILGETGLIKPGEYIQSVTLNENLKSGTDIILKLMAYEPGTYYSAGAVSLNTTVQ